MLNSCHLSHKNIPLFGVGCGLLVGAIYWNIELFILALLPALVHPTDRHNLYFHPGYSALFLLIYLALGMLLGALSAVCLFRLSAWFRGADLADRRWAVGATLTILVLLIFAANPLSRDLDVTKTEFFGQKALALFLCCGMIAGLPFRGLRRLALPAAALGVYMSTLRLLELHAVRRHGTIATAGAYIVWALAIVVAVAAVGAWVRNRRPSGWLPARALAVALGVALVQLALSAAVKPLPIRHAWTATAAPASRPNVILIVMDTVRADHLSAYGYQHDTSPTLKRLAGEATLYRRATAAGDMTLAAHGSMFTGLYPTRHHAHYSLEEPYGNRLNGSETLADNLSNHGYSTAAVVSNYGYLAAAWGFDKGFAYYDQRSAPEVFFHVPTYCLRNVLETFAGLFPASARVVYRPAEAVNADASTALDELQSRKQPFFLFLNYMDAHFPYVDHAPFDRQYPAGGGIPTREEREATFRKVLLDGQPLSEEERQRLVPRYDANIAYLDSQLERLFQDLRRRGLWDNSLVLVTSDHGEGFGEKGCIDHGGMAVYENQVDIPLIVKYPNGKAAVVDQRVSQVDLMPTVLDVLGFEVPKSLDGVSLLRLDQNSDRMVFAESYPGHNALRLNPRKFRWIHRAAYLGDQKLLSSEDGAIEQYDLSKDPGETRNLYQRDSAMSQQISHRLLEWQKSLAGYRQRRPSKLDPAAIQNLKSLGYAGGK